MPIPQEVEAVALLGWHLYPASRRSRAGMFEGASDAATCDLDTIEDWCRRFPGCNWRVVFGPSDLWGLDLDVPRDGGHKEDGVAAFAALAKVHGGIPPRPQMRSGGGGVAIFFDHSDGERIIGKTGHPAPGIDPRRGRLSQTIPPSVHIVTGRPYIWVTPPWLVTPPKAPPWLLRLMEPPPEPSSGPAPDLPSGSARRNYAVAVLHSAIRQVAAAPPGTANDTLNRKTWAVAKFTADGSLSDNEVRDCMMAAARARNIPPREACLTIDSALRAKR
jgi:hypothetical protein